MRPFDFFFFFVVVFDVAIVIWSICVMRRLSIEVSVSDLFWAFAPTGRARYSEPAHQKQFDRLHRLLRLVAGVQVMVGLAIMVFLP